MKALRHEDSVKQMGYTNIQFFLVPSCLRGKNCSVFSGSECAADKVLLQVLDYYLTVPHDQLNVTDPVRLVPVVRGHDDR